jgi:hypothetical protein
LPQNQKGEFSSTWKTIKNYVPQGSILGSLLFIIYINDLHYVINACAKPVIYADDTRVFITANNLNSKLNYTSARFSFNGFSLNIAKTNILKFSANHLQNDPFEITYQTKTITEATSIQFFGLELDKQMNLKNHNGKNSAKNEQCRLCS